MLHRQRNNEDFGEVINLLKGLESAPTFEHGRTLHIA